MSIETSVVAICDQCGLRSRGEKETNVGYTASYSDNHDGWFALTIFAWGDGVQGARGLFCSTACLYAFVASYSPEVAP